MPATTGFSLKITPGGHGGTKYHKLTWSIFHNSAPREIGTDPLPPVDSDDTQMLPRASRLVRKSNYFQSPHRIPGPAALRCVAFASPSREPYVSTYVGFKLFLLTTLTPCPESTTHPLVRAHHSPRHQPGSARATALNEGINDLIHWHLPHNRQRLTKLAPRLRIIVRV